MQGASSRLSAETACLESKRARMASKGYYVPFRFCQTDEYILFLRFNYRSFFLVINILLHVIVIARR